MIKTAIYVLVFACMTFPGFASTIGNVKVLEASDTIKYRINDLAKNYLLLTKFPHKRELSLVLHHDLAALGKSFQEIALTTRDAKTKGLLTYFAYEKARLEVILDQHPSQENAGEIMDISESFLEGAEAIARHHAYPFSPEEKMFKTTLSMSEHLESIAKYYLAHELTKNDPEILKKMGKETAVVSKDMEAIIRYRYTDETVAKARDSIVLTWQTLKPHIHQAQKEKGLPMVVNAGITHINTLLHKLGIYHSKNQ